MPDTHPAVILIRHVERDFRWCAGAMDEQHDAIGLPRRAPASRVDALAHVELRRLPEIAGTDDFTRT